MLPAQPKVRSLTALKFDDILALPEGGGPIDAPTVRGALRFTAFSISSSTPALLIPPPSKPNYIYISPVGEVAGGEHQLFPANASVKYFNLEKIAYACAAESGSAPISCTIQVSGKRAPQFGGTEEQALLVYSRPVITGATVTAGTYNTFSFPAPQFQGLVSVTFNIISPQAALQATLGDFDNLQYTAFIEK